ncbi:MAG: ABC transporter permease [Acidobacteria bacterium]|nr:MAG: ABC transporter permease [Acidobacteriota bacterium]
MSVQGPPPIRTEANALNTNGAQQRSGSPHQSMLLRMLFRSAVRRRGRVVTALSAMVVAAAVTTAVLNLYADVQAKLGTEFRSYGANIIVVAKEGMPLPADALQVVESALEGRGIAVPFAYVVARTSDGHSVVVAGTDFDRIRRLDRWWKVSAWPATSGEVLVGRRAAAVVNPQSGHFELSFQGHAIKLTSAGFLETGAGEDSRIYMPLGDFVKWTGVQPSTIEVAATGSTKEISAVLRKLEDALPTADVCPVRQIVEGEANVLNKTRATLLAASVLIILTAALCVLATLTGWVFDRRRDFAIMKALGASQRLINGFFATQAAAMGVAGALLGFAVGIGVASWIGRVNFHAPVTPRFVVLPLVLAGSVVVALLAAVLPIGLLRRVQPANILRGE